MDDMERSRRALSSLLGLRDLEVPNAGCACNPSGAKNLVGLAVQVTKIRRGRVDREQQNGFLSIHKSATDHYLQTSEPLSFPLTHVKCLVGALTAAKTCFISSSHKEKQFLRLRSGRQSGLPVGQVERGDCFLLDLLLDHLLNGRNHRSRRGEVRLGLVEPPLDTVSQRNLLLGSSKRGEDREERSQAHDASNRRVRVSYNISLAFFHLSTAKATHLS